MMLDWLISTRYGFLGFDDLDKDFTGLNIFGPVEPDEGEFSTMIWSKHLLQPVKNTPGMMTWKAINGLD